MPDFLTTEETQKELAELRRGAFRTWGEISRLLSSVELHGTWRQEAGSFTEWLKQFALQLNKKEGSLWRYLTAGRYYNDLRRKLMMRDVECPRLPDLPDRVSAENLELLSKLERVAPPDVLCQLSERVVSGVASRSELRDAWVLFRPILDGHTARGNIRPPQYNPADLMQSETMFKVMVTRGLTENKNVLIGDSGFDIYRVFTSFEVIHHSPHSRYYFNALVVTALNKTGDIKFHGIEAISWDNTDNISKIYELMKFCDFMWIALPEKMFETWSESQLDEIHDAIGILTSDGHGMLRVKRPASSCQDIGVNKTHLRDLLLLKLL